MTKKLFAIRLAAAAVFALLIAGRANAEVMQFDCRFTATAGMNNVVDRLQIDTQKPDVKDQVLEDGKGTPIEDVRPSTVQVSAASIRWTYKRGTQSQTNSLDLKTGVWLETFASGTPDSVTESYTCVKGTAPFPTPTETNSNTTNDLSGSVGAQVSPAPQANMAGGQAQAEILNLRCHQTDPEPGLGYTQYIILWIDFDQRTITWELEDHQLLLPATMQTMPVEITPEAFNYNPMGQNPTGINRQTGTYRSNNTFGQTEAGVCVKDSVPFPTGKF